MVFLSKKYTLITMQSYSATHIAFIPHISKLLNSTCQTNIVLYNFDNIIPTIILFNPYK